MSAPSPRVCSCPEGPLGHNALKCDRCGLVRDAEMQAALDDVVKRFTDHFEELLMTNENTTRVKKEHQLLKPEDSP